MGAAAARAAAPVHTLLTSRTSEGGREGEAGRHPCRLAAAPRPHQCLSTIGLFCMHRLFASVRVRSIRFEPAVLSVCLRVFSASLHSMPASCASPFHACTARNGLL